MPRTDSTQLPRSQELADIIAREALRPIAAGTENLHFVGFDRIIALLKAYSLGADFFEKEVTPDEVVSGGLLERGEEVAAALAAAILSGLPSESQRQALDSAYAYLSEEDALVAADAALVFGSKGNFRIEKGVELYQAGLVSKLLLSGGRPAYAGPEAQPEAERFLEIAVAAGISENDLLLETESITLADNVRRSFTLIERERLPIRRLILVNSPYVQRRGWAFAMKYAPAEMEFMRVNCRTAETFSAEQWFHSGLGLHQILGEYVKLKVAVSLNTA